MYNTTTIYKRTNAATTTADSYCYQQYFLRQPQAITAITNSTVSTTTCTTVSSKGIYNIDQEYTRRKGHARREGERREGEEKRRRGGGGEKKTIGKLSATTFKVF